MSAKEVKRVKSSKKEQSFDKKLNQPVLQQKQKRNSDAFGTISARKRAQK